MPRPTHNTPPVVYITDSSLLNNVDDDFVTHGYVNNIYTPIIVDTGAKRSLVSSDLHHTKSISRQI